MYQDLSLVAVFVFVYSVLAGKLERTPVSGAIVFATFGLVLGPLGLGVLNLDVTVEGLRTLAELTLALVLFIDAGNANLGVLRQSIHLPRRLLMLGLPLTIGLGIAVGALIFDGLTIVEIAILATMLAPTDAALGKAVVTNKSVPVKIRESLNVESGLNDGICVPVLFIFLALATSSDVEGGAHVLALTLLAEEIGIGLAVGVGLTVLGSYLYRFAARREWISKTWRQLNVVALAMACFAVAQWLGGSGFIASFAGGIVFNQIAREDKHELCLAAEGTGDTLALITWVMFGSTVVAQAIDSFSWQVVVYALLSLTVIRMLPVFLVLSGTGLQTRDKLFVGWFGPRGLASVVFAVIVLNENLPGGHLITMTVATTIIFSVIGHGLSAVPTIGAMSAGKKDG